MRRIITRTLVPLLLALLPLQAAAAALLRDPDIEYALNRLAAPIYAAAGLSAQRMKIVVVKDDRPNAFVADTSHVFIHSGLMLTLKNAAELQAVIAHEVAHITGGHITRRRINAKRSGTVSAVGILLSGALVAAGANSDAAAGVAMGVASSAQRVLFAHTREEEASADQVGIRYMEAAGVPPQAMLDVLEIFRGQEVLSEHRQDPYARTHPLSRERLRALRGYVAASGVKTNRDTDAQYWYARARGKLEAFLRAPSKTLRSVKKTDTSDIGLMRRAIALHRFPKPDDAIATVAQLVASRPKDPFYAGLQGQILLESRSFNAAVNAYRRANKLAPGNGQILKGLGRALLAAGGKSNINAAIKALEGARAREPLDAGLLRHLAAAYAQTGNAAMAALNGAESHVLRGDFRAAMPLAERAAASLGHGSVGWNRAMDVIQAGEIALKGK